jgi:hypothetical protein
MGYASCGAHAISHERRLAAIVREQPGLSQAINAHM